MESRINKALLLLTIALLSPLGLGTLDRAPAASLTEPAAEAQLAATSVSAPPSSITKVISTSAKTQNAKLKTQNLFPGWAITTHTLYERATFSRNTLSSPAAVSRYILVLHPGSSAGGLWRLSPIADFRLPIADC